jgi:hypothetical protein
MKNSSSFTEIQRFRQLWVWVILFGILLLPVYGVYQQIVLDRPFGNNPMSDVGLILLTSSVAVFVLLFAVMKLSTHISVQFIEWQLFPFVHKKVRWEEVEKADIINYGFVGGWGIRPWTRYGTVYNMQGNMGLAIQLKTGKKYLIGTMRPDELKSFLDQLHTNHAQ